MVSLTREDVKSVLGPVDEIMVADVLATQATLEELSQAWAWLNSDEALIGQGRSLPTGRVAELVDLLAPVEDEP
jgi:hypothetical protein